MTKGWTSKTPYADATTECVALYKYHLPQWYGTHSFYLTESTIPSLVSSQVEHHSWKRIKVQHHVWSGTTQSTRKNDVTVNFQDLPYLKTGANNYISAINHTISRMWTPCTKGDSCSFHSKSNNQCRIQDKREPKSTYTFLVFPRYTANNVGHKK